MSVKDIILYKKRFKNQAILLRKARRVLDQRIDSGSDDGDGSGEDLDDNVSNPSVSSASTRGSSSRQLAGSKRKRKQTIGEKSAKGAANQQRKSLSSKKSLKPCTACINHNRLDTAYSHTRTTNSLCPVPYMLAQQQQQQQQQQEHQEEHQEEHQQGHQQEQEQQQQQGQQQQRPTTTITRKIGLRSVLNIDNLNNHERILNGINEVVVFIRYIVIKAHLFVTYFVYSNLDNGRPVPKQLFTKSFFYAVYQLIIGGKISVNNTISQQLATKIHHSNQQMNPTADRMAVFNVQKIHGGIAYSHCTATIFDHYATLLTNRITEEMMQWMANIYSLRLRERQTQPQQQQRPEFDLQHGLRHEEEQQHHQQQQQYQLELLQQHQSQSQYYLQQQQYHQVQQNYHQDQQRQHRQQQQNHKDQQQQHQQRQQHDDERSQQHHQQ
ncbi:hypothetical protein BC941DRAFT_194532 [Chlamydoabsidia padenii]|nr:hypothetical protein BC941DRAFT_194532 [Chlamydoabsidia padenii]